jgi:hypothetical protein
VDTVNRVDEALRRSHQLRDEYALLTSNEANVDDIWQTILQKKRFTKDASETSAPAIVLHCCLQRINASYRLIQEILECMNTPFDKTCTAHEDKLLEVRPQCRLRFSFYLSLTTMSISSGNS